MSTKIQINSLEALERLIGNDNELEIEIRNSVVQNFTNKHLKGIVKTLAENEFDREGFKRMFNDIFTKRGYRVELTEEYKTVVQRQVDAALRNTVMDIIGGLSGSIGATIDQKLNVYVSQAVASKIKEITKTHIEQKAKELIAEKLS